MREMDSNLLVRLDQYVTELFAQEDDALKQAQQNALSNGIPRIHIQPFEGRLLQFLAEITNAQKIVEIGTLAGYSGIWLARSLAPEGKLYTLELDPKHAAVAQENFANAGLAEKVEIRQGIALESLEALRSEAPFDFIFIDADKVSYPQYLAWAIDNVRSGGLIVAHNALTSDGRPRVFPPFAEGDQQVVEYNQAIADDERLSSFIIGAGAGMSVAMKK
jgi:caffeoyl-CoA O-methyltransferase